MCCPDVIHENYHISYTLTVVGMLLKALWPDIKTFLNLVDFNVELPVLILFLISIYPLNICN